jgi:hypothetical protein
VGVLVWFASVLAGSSAAARQDPYARYLAPPTVCSGSGQDGFADVKVLECLVDHARLVRGVRPLRPSTELNRAAALKLADEIRCGKLLSHDPCGSGWSSAYRRAGYTPGHKVHLGENLGYAAGPGITPRLVVDMWLHSRRHRRNLFDPRFREAGFAAVSAGEGVLYAVSFGTRSQAG